MAKILLSNDDGHYATGIRTLVETLARFHDVYVVAPDRERSAMGHALTLHKPLRVDEIDMGPNVKGAFAVTGTPSDCVKIALNALLDEKPDMVISGINHGPNLGFDVLYSGTVSAAFEGALHDLPSVAVSLLNGFDKNADFRPSADFIADFVPVLLDHVKLPPRTILNINTPAIPYCDMTGVKMTQLGVRMYTDSYEKRVDPRNQVYYWLAGEVVDVEESEESDITAIRNNQISVTPVTFDLTNHQVASTYNQVFEGHFEAIMGKRVC